jgi:hypothetical protein
MLKCLDNELKLFFVRVVSEHRYVYTIQVSVY